MDIENDQLVMDDGTSLSEISADTVSEMSAPTSPKRKVSFPLDVKSSRIMRDNMALYVTGGRELSDEVDRLRLSVNGLAAIQSGAENYNQRILAQLRTIRAASHNLWNKLHRKDFHDEHLTEQYFYVIKDYFNLLTQLNVPVQSPSKKSIKSTQSKDSISLDKFHDNNNQTLEIISEIEELPTPSISATSSEADTNSNSINQQIDTFIGIVNALEVRVISSYQTRVNREKASVKHGSYTHLGRVPRNKTTIMSKKRRRLIICSIILAVLLALGLTAVLLLLHYHFKILPCFTTC